MEVRVELGWLLDFYGALLTDKRREIMRLWCEEDMSLSELGDQLGISRQAASDALAKAGAQLREYEEKLGLLSQFRAITDAAGECRRAIARAKAGDSGALADAERAVDEILRIER